MNPSRRLFVVDAAAGTATLLLAACGGGSDYSSSPSPSPSPSPAPPPAGTLSCSATVISANHGHALTVAAADLDSMVDKIYGIQAASDHNHLVTLSPVQLAQIKAGTAVTVQSTAAADGHAHAVTVNCS
jgi:hypothetical protein